MTLLGPLRNPVGSVSTVESGDLFLQERRRFSGFPPRRTGG